MNKISWTTPEPAATGRFGQIAPHVVTTEDWGYQGMPR